MFHYIEEKFYSIQANFYDNSFVILRERKAYLKTSRSMYIFNH